MRLMMSGFKWSRMRPVNSESRNASCLSVEGSRKENPSRERIIKRLAKKKKKLQGLRARDAGADRAARQISQRTAGFVSLGPQAPNSESEPRCWIFTCI